MIRYLAELYNFRELLIALVKREIKVRYKQTSLGAAWAILQPVSLMLIFSLVFGTFLGLESQGLPYPIFYYSALLTWLFFSTSILANSNFVVNNIKVQGLQRISVDAVLKAMPLKVGQTYTDEIGNKIISKLFQTGFFSNVTLSRDTDTLVVHVVERPTIGSNDITGNKKIKTSQLRPV